MKRKFHVRCEVGEKSEIISKSYLSLFNGYQYIVDNNTQTVYDLPRNDFQLFLEELIEKGKIILEPYGRRMSKSLLQDLEKVF